MKNLLTIFLVVIPTFFAFAQMTNIGYQKLTLGMSVAQAKKLVNFSLTKNNEAKITYDNKPFKLTFNDNQLWMISSSASNVKLDGINTPIVGKHYSVIKALLGNKLKAADLGGASNEYYIYYKDKKYENNYETSCVLHFNEKKILTRIFSSYNP